MTERLVLCGGLGAQEAATKNTIELSTSGERKNITLDIGDIRRRMIKDPPDMLTDLIEIAAYVYCADQFTSRGSNLMANLGADWRREFRFRIPVRTPDLWNSSDVMAALTETLGFLSEDEYSFEFLLHPNPPTFQSYLAFDETSDRGFKPDEVIMFSGGLDSFAGAVEKLNVEGRNVALVSHRSSTMVNKKQRQLVDALRQRTNPNQLFHVPVEVHKSQVDGRDFTQRSRSFLFAALGTTVAQMFGLDRVLFFENGVVSLNLPSSAHVLGARATRTTHPRVLHGFGRLFSTLLDKDIAVENPFFWKSKVDVVRTIAERGFADLIKDTFSCTRVREATKKSRHCGVCSQCIDRRFAVLAAGMGGEEPASNYDTDLLLGERKPGRDVTMAESYLLSATKMSKMTEMGFLAAHGEVFRALRYLPGSLDENARKIYEMHKRQAEGIVAVMAQEIGKHASLLGTQSLEPSSLLSLAVSQSARQPVQQGMVEDEPRPVAAMDKPSPDVHKDPIEKEPTSSDQADADGTVFVERPIVIAFDDDKKRVLFHSEIHLVGAGYNLMSALAETFREDGAAGTRKDDHRFVRASTLAEKLSIEEQSVRQRVSRCRRDIRNKFLKKSGHALGDEDVIENQGWHGYRLNPYLILVSPTEIAEEKDPG